VAASLIYRLAMRARLLLIGTCLALVAAACGGSDSADETSGPAEEAPADDTTTSGSAVLDETTTSTTTTTSTSSTTTTTTTTTTTLPPVTQLPAVTVADLPDLVVSWGNGTDDPLLLAQQLIGFPLDLAAPDGAAPSEVDLDLRADDPAQWRWEWSYQVFTPPGSVQDIDVELPEGGPGTIEGRLYYDPLFEALGWRNVGQVISDPSNGAGGPQSVNWSYQDDDGIFTIGTLDTEPTSARAWVYEDVAFGQGDGRPGHRIEINALTAPDIVPVPLIASLLAALPTIDGRLTDLSVDSFTRPADSFDAEEGLRYLEIEFEWTLTAGATPDAAGAAYLAALPNAIVQEGEESFFDEGVIEIREPQVGGALNDWEQSVILLDRYPGSIAMNTEDDASVTATLDVRLEPNREVLQPPAG
jgi:hypothetical protein